jgi:lysophospholipase L1-like esterase
MSNLRTPPAITIPYVPSNIFLHHTTLEPRPKLILLGDSITEQGSSSNHGWATSLTIHYNRRMDVLNRGLGGYNTHWGLAVLPLILEEILGPSSTAEQEVDEHTANNNNDVGQCQKQEEEVQKQDIIPQYTFIIAYGANDSCLRDGPHSRHHVPINDYSNNLQRMIQMIQTWNSSKTTTTTTMVVLMTPPPCDTSIQYPSRDNENSTRLYAETCVLVGKKNHVPVVDLWNGMQQQQQQQQQLPSQLSSSLSLLWQEEYLSDGLHLTPMGNYRVYELLLQVLEEDDVDRGFLGFTIPNLPRSYPDHTMVNATHLVEVVNNNT